MPYLDLEGRKVYYEDHGEGPVVVLLHHGFGSSEMWRGLLPPLVMAGFRAVMYDRRGYGRSDGGPDFREFYLGGDFRRAMAGELALVQDALGIASAHLVGQCEGGVLALDYARLHPHRVPSLTVASTQCHSPGDMRQANQRWFPTAFRDLDPKVRRKMIDWHGPDLAEERFELYRYLGGAYGVGAFDLRPALPEVEAPALVIYPDRSALFPVEQAVDLYRGLPRGRLAVIPACGHNTYEQKPQEYARILLEFLREQAFGAEIDRPFFTTCAG